MAPALSRRARRVLGATAGAAAAAVAVRAARDAGAFDALASRWGWTTTTRAGVSEPTTRGADPSRARRDRDARRGDARASVADAAVALERELDALNEATLREGAPETPAASDAAPSSALPRGASSADLSSDDARDAALGAPGAPTLAPAPPAEGCRASSASESSAPPTRAGSSASSGSFGGPGPAESGSGPSSAAEGTAETTTPDFFASTKFFACLELEESRELFDEAAEEFDVPPNTVVFRQGDDSSSGIYIVVQGALGVYLQEERGGGGRGGGGSSSSFASPSRRGGPPGTSSASSAASASSASSASASAFASRSYSLGAGFPLLGSGESSAADTSEPSGRGSSSSARRLGPPFLTNVLREGESVGDVDVLDNAPRGVSCIAMERGARLVRIRQDKLFAFIERHPRALRSYLQEAVARLWRVAHFVTVDFLGLPGGSGGDAVRLISENEGVESEGVEAEGVEAEGVEAEGVEAEGVEAEAEASKERPTVPAAEASKERPTVTSTSTPHSDTLSAKSAGGSRESASAATTGPAPPGSSASAATGPRGSSHSSSTPPSSSPRGRPPRARPSPASRLMRHLPDLLACCEEVDLEASRGLLYAEGDAADAFFVVLAGAARADAVPWPAGNGARGPPTHAPALVGGSAFLTRSARQETIRVEAAARSDGGSAEDADEKSRRSGDNTKNTSSSRHSPLALPPRVLRVDSAALERLRVTNPKAYVDALLASSCSLARLLRLFISLGLNRVWLTAGEAAYAQGEDATSMFVLISGRIRLQRRPDADGERDEGHRRGRRDASISASSASSSSSSSSSFASSSFASSSVPRRGSGHYRARPNEERGRGDTIGEAPLLAGGRYPSTAVCLRDSELVRMSRGALTLVCARYPGAASRLLEAMARKLHATLRGAKSRPDLVTIALVPAKPGADEAKAARLARALREALERKAAGLGGATLVLDEGAVAAQFPDGETMRRLGSSKFYRSKLTGWMAQLEENYRFILLLADARASPWSHVCASQADRVLVVAETVESGESFGAREDARFAGSRFHHPRGVHPSSNLTRKGTLADPAPTEAECALLWRRRSGGGAPVELALVFDSGASPIGLRAWRDARPDLLRHHCLRLGSREDVERLARRVAGRGVGVVLTGGGGHGLAHLGALRALEDAGVPIDCVGGTSQGALMAALYARHASTTHTLPRVKALTKALRSPRHLLTDLTLPVLSLFSGKGVDAILKAALGEGTRAEDLWLGFFCCSANLTRGRLQTHTQGEVWRCVRASMTVLGLLPPVADEATGDVLVDGGYLNPIPVDVMREKMGVETVIVVDVEDEDYLAFRNLTPHDGGLGGWRLLWDRATEPTRASLARLADAWRDARARVFRLFSSPAKNADGREHSAGGNEDPRSKKDPRGPPPFPSYASLLDALMSATSRAHAARAGREHGVDLYLRPPGVSGWTAPSDDRRTEALVRAAHAHSCAKIAEWCRAASLEEAICRSDAARASAAERDRSREEGNRSREGDRRSLAASTEIGGSREPRATASARALQSERPFQSAALPNRTGAAAERPADGEIRRRVLFAAQQATREEPDAREDAGPETAAASGEPPPSPSWGGDPASPGGSDDPPASPGTRGRRFVGVSGSFTSSSGPSARSDSFATPRGSLAGSTAASLSLEGSEPLEGSSRGGSDDPLFSARTRGRGSPSPRSPRDGDRDTGPPVVKRAVEAELRDDGDENAAAASFPSTARSSERGTAAAAKTRGDSDLERAPTPVPAERLRDSRGERFETCDIHPDHDRDHDRKHAAAHARSRSSDLGGGGSNAAERRRERALDFDFAFARGGVAPGAAVFSAVNDSLRRSDREWARWESPARPPADPSAASPGPAPRRIRRGSSAEYSDEGSARRGQGGEAAAEKAAAEKALLSEAELERLLSVTPTPLERAGGKGGASFGFARGGRRRSLSASNLPDAVSPSA